jgi:hypothetical protein
MKYTGCNLKGPVFLPTEGTYQGIESVGRTPPTLLNLSNCHSLNRYILSFEFDFCYELNKKQKKKLMYRLFEIALLITAGV